MAKRGHTSKIGILFVLLVLIGEALDYEVLSLVCYGVGFPSPLALSRDLFAMRHGSALDMLTHIPWCLVVKMHCM